MTLPCQSRVLAIDPASRGFGFAVLEGPQCLIDWGFKEIRDNKKARTLKYITDLIDQYEPEVIVGEDMTDGASRRCHRIQELNKDISDLALKRKIAFRQFSRLKVREAFTEFNVTTKHQIAKVIVAGFPELDPYLPPFRKPWMSEDSRMAIFDAISFALTYFHDKQNRKLMEGVMNQPF